MPEYFGNTNLQINGTGIQFMTKEYLIDAYPSLVDNFKTAGLWVWGDNRFGQLGDNTITNRSSPVQTISNSPNWKQVDCGNGTYIVGAIKTDGTLWMWGRNLNGVLGDNTTTNRSSPVQTVSAGTNWKQVSCGGSHTAAIKTDNTLWLWGFNYTGQLGTNNTTTRSSPVQTISAGTNWKQVSAGSIHTGAIKTDGTLWTWGRNYFGQLGNNSTTDRSSPVQTVSAGTNWKQVSCGSNFTAAIKTDGTLWTWGFNGYGQLGDNTDISKSSPVQTISTGTNWKLVSCGGYTTTSIKTDGTLWLWGRNYRGRLGDNTITNRSSPVQTISGGTNWNFVSSGVYHTAAIKTDGTLWTWGFNGYGQLGDNAGGVGVGKSSPVQTVAGGNNWKQVAAGISQTASIRDDSLDPFRLDTL